MSFSLRDARFRRFIYAALTPIAALLVFYGLLSEAEVALWLGLAGTLLLSGEGAMAAVNAKDGRSEHVAEEG